MTQVVTTTRTAEVVAERRRRGTAVCLRSLRPGSITFFSTENSFSR